MAIGTQTLTRACEQVAVDFKRDTPQFVLDIMLTDWRHMFETFDYSKTIHAGDTMPPFELLDTEGQKLQSTDLLKKGPLLIKFYRGGWCPFDKLELAEFEKHVDQFKAKGVTLIGVSPELPHALQETREKFGVSFPLYTDKDTLGAKRLKMFWAMPEAWRPLYSTHVKDLGVQHGNPAWELPVPATLLVDQDGVVRNAFINADYSKRLEPTVALGWTDAL